MRGNAMSGAPIISGTSQLPKPPIIAGMIMKNTMIKPWPVTKTLKVCGSLNTCRPGYISSARIIIEKKPPMQPAIIAKIRVHRADVLMVGGIDVAPPACGVMRMIAAIVMEFFVMSVESEIGHGGVIPISPRREWRRSRSQQTSSWTQQAKPHSPRRSPP